MLSISVAVTLGSSGFLYSQSTVDGLLHFAVYVEPLHRGLRLIYRLDGGVGLLSTLFPVDIDDDKRHLVVVRVQSLDLSVSVDDGPANTTQLSARVAPCTAHDCIVFVGQTQGLPATPTSVHAIHGCFFNVSLESNIAVRRAHLDFDLLDPTAHDGASPVVADGTSYCFNRSGLLAIPPIPRISTIFSLSINATFESTASG